MSIIISLVTGIAIAKIIVSIQEREERKIQEEKRKEAEREELEREIRNKEYEILMAYYDEQLELLYSK